MSELPQGHRIGAYEIRSLLGRGGMGEVYRAHDPRLHRDVAIKILPDALSSDADRLTRFEREARVLASLNHPNIAAIYGVEDRALVLELVDGETLAERIQRGAIARDEAIDIARQIADGLEAAHEAGIVHRDLKPANIKITPAGMVKILDFGIAKVTVTGADQTRTATELGTVIGTAAYMSPEQARGLHVDKRSDIWSFGCVLFELLTGRPAFAKATPTDTLAAILEHDPDWAAVPARTPATIVTLLGRCLVKDARDRLRDIGEARVAMAAPRLDTAPAAARVSRAPLVAAIVIAAIAVSAAAALYFWRAPASPAPTISFRINPPPAASFRSDVPRTFFALSRDGSQIAFVASESGRGGIWVQTLGELDARLIPGTERTGGPAWSPDGQSLAFFVDDQLKRVDLRSGVVSVICDTADTSRQSASWGAAGNIVFASIESGAILIVPAGGGTPEVVVKRDESAGQTRILFPMFLPDGRRFLYVVQRADGTSRLAIAAKGAPPREIGTVESNMGWIDPGYLISSRSGGLIAQRFDVDREQIVGEPVVVTDKVDFFRSTLRAQFAASPSGTIAYHSGIDQSQLTWFDRSGRITGTIGEIEGHLSARISPDGGRLVFDRRGPRTQGWDLWIRDLARDVETRVTADPGSEVTPVWIDDGRALVYGADRGGSSPHLFKRDLNTGTDVELRAGGRQQQSLDVSPDGKTLGMAERGPGGNFEMYLMPLARPSEAARVGAATRFMEMGPWFSPDGRAITFTSNRSGRLEVYVASLAAPAAAVTISPAGGASPRWSRDGREVTYIDSDGRLMASAIRTTPELAAGAAVPLFSLPSGLWIDYEAAAGGRFLAVVLKQPADQQPLSALLNWRPPDRR